MDNLILGDLQYTDFGDDPEYSKYTIYNNNATKDIIKNWLFVYVVKDQNINEACFSKELLTNAYKNIFDNENVEIDKIFNENELTNNYICYSKKESDIKEYKSLQIKYSDGELDNSYYEIIDNSGKTIDIEMDNRKYVNSISIFQEAEYNKDNEIKNLINKYVKDREFDKSEIVEWIGESHIHFLKGNDTYDLGNGEEKNVITLNNGKMIVELKDKKVTVPINNIKEVILDGKDKSYELRGNHFYILTEEGEVYYYDSIGEGEITDDNGKTKNITLEESVKNYKKIKVDKKVKNFVFKRVESDYNMENETLKREILMEILFKLEDDTLYSIKNNKVVDYLLDSKYDKTTFYENGDVAINNKKIKYKYKSFLNIEHFKMYGGQDYFITEDDYLYDVENNKLVNNSKIDKIYVSSIGDQLYEYTYLIVFKNKELATVTIVNI